jgi:hypothetical protein
MWEEYFNKPLIVSLPARQDRRDLITQQFSEYGISVYLYDAIKDKKGYYGLLLTMKQLFKECLNEGCERVLIFEDDAKIIVPCEMFHETMNACAEQLSLIQWDLFYLGMQHVREFGRFKSMNLLPVTCAYSTHAVAYSKHAMEFFLRGEFDEPIDNWLVRCFQPYGTSYCSYPLLCTQYDTYSDIGGDKPNWDRFITPTFKKNVLNAMHTRNF